MQQADALGVQDGDQPRSRVAAVERKHVVGTQAIQGLEQHLPLADLGAMHAGMQGQFRAGKVQGEQALIGARRGAVQPMAGPHRRRQERGVGGDHAQPLPRGNHPRGSHALHESVVDGAQRIGAQAITRSGERTIRRYALRQRTVSEVGEEVVQPRLLRLIALAQHGGDQGRQRQLVSPGEGVGRVLATRRLGEVRRVDVVVQIPQDALDIFAILRPTWSEPRNVKKINELRHVLYRAAGPKFAGLLQLLTDPVNEATLARDWSLGACDSCMFLARRGQRGG